MVALGYKVKSGSNHSIKYQCAGALISDTWVLTTAHCINRRLLIVKTGSVSILYKIKKSKYKFFLQIDQVSLKDGSLYNNFNIKSYRKHPDFKGTLQFYDIGLIELFEPVPVFGLTTRPICLPSAANSKSYDENYSIAGWTLLKDNPVIYNLFLNLVFNFFIL